MKRTFNYRRAGIVEGMPMPEILTNYPAFKQVNEVIG